MRKLLLVLGCIGLWGLTAGAATDADLQIEAVRESRETLQILFKDSELVDNACDFFLKRMEYLPAIQTLVLDVERNFCPMDIYGQGIGEVSWTLPTSLRGFEDLKLIVNGQSRGTVQLTPETAQWAE